LEVKCSLAAYGEAIPISALKQRQLTAKESVLTKQQAHESTDHTHLLQKSSHGLD